MDVSFRTHKLQKLFNSDRELKKAHGQRMAKLMRECLDDLCAIERLLDIERLPQHRCHELKGNKKGVFSLDLEHPYRLLFVPDHDPVPELEAGGIDWALVTAVVIDGVEDTHG